MARPLIAVTDSVFPSLDPAKAAVANLPGGASDAVGGTPLPEFKVVRLRGVEGACQ